MTIEQLTDEEIKKEKPLSADFVSFRAGVRCAERLYAARVAKIEDAPAPQAQQEPVAWSFWQSCRNDDGTQTAPWAHRYSKSKPTESIINRDITPLYAAPAPQAQQPLKLREAVWDEQIKALMYELGMEKSTRVYATLKRFQEKIEQAAGAAPAPQAQQPLSDEQIMDLSRGECGNFRWPSSALNIARAIEASHGIGEKK